MREQAEGTSLWRRSGALRWTVYLLLIFVVPQSILWVTLDTINRRKVEQKLQALRDAGEPVTRSEAAPAPVPDDQNAAVLYQQVIRVDFNNYSNSTNVSLLEATGHSDLIIHEFDRDGSKAAEARAVLNDPAVISILETLEEGSMRPECVFPLHWEDGAMMLSPHYPQMREAARWLARKARLCAMDGDPDGAMRWLAVLFRMSDHTAREPAFISLLVAGAIRGIGLSELEWALSEGTPSAQAANDLLDCLGRLDVKERFNQALPSERALGIDIYTLLRRPDQGYYWPETESLREGGLAYCYRFGVFRPLYNADLIEYLTRMEDMIRRSSQVPATSAPPPTPRRRGPFGLDLDLKRAVDLFSYPDLYLNARDRAIMRIDIAEVAMALTLYRIEHGEYPATLDELQATLDWELPQDFFAGAPMSYQRRGDGFTLYSFGPDRDDDGGVKGKRKDGDSVWECDVGQGD